MDRVLRSQRGGQGDVAERVDEEAFARPIDRGLGAAPSRDGTRGGSSSSRRQEAALLRSAAEGDLMALRVLIDEHLTAIHGFIYVSVGPAAAEDIMQETLLEAIGAAGSFRGDSALSTWLHTIAKRRIFRHYDKERRQRVVTEQLTFAARNEEVEVDRQDQVSRALAQLSPIHRQVVIMKYLNDMSVAEIANAVGKTRTQVQSLLQRARVALRKALVHDEF